MNGSTGLIAITPAHQEGPHLARLIESVIRQDMRPDLWVIVDDASTDDTAAVADAYAQSHPFIQVLRRPRQAGRRISSKADAVRAGYEAAIAAGPHPTYVASIDADVELPPHAFAHLLDQFAANPRLGVTGGHYLHPVAGRMEQAWTAPHQVPGVLQVFRAEVYDAIGGYQPLPYGGLDVVSTAHARLLGWETRAFPEVSIAHHRQMGTGGGRSPLVAEYFKGKQDHSIGGGFVFEVLKCARRVFTPPLFAAAGARLVGYLSLTARRTPRVVAPEIAAFIRHEQKQRLLAALRPRHR